MHRPIVRPIVYLFNGGGSVPPPTPSVTPMPSVTPTITPTITPSASMPFVTPLIYLNFENGLINNDGVIPLQFTAVNTARASSDNNIKDDMSLYLGILDEKSYIYSDPVAPFLVNTDDFTVEFFLRIVKTPTGLQTIVGHANTPASVDRNWVVCIVSGVFNVGIGTPNFPMSGIPYSIYKTHHYAFTKSGRTLKAYLDGVLVSTYVNNSDFIITQTTYPIILGGYGNNNSASSYLNGALDDVKVYNYLRYTDNFIPPQRNSSIIDGDQPLIDMDFEDGIINHGSLGDINFITIGEATIDNTNPIHGTGSLYLKHPNSYIYSSTPLNLLKGDNPEFTIEFSTWIERYEVPMGIMSIGDWLSVYIPSAGNLAININGTIITAKLPTNTFAANMRNIMAITRSKTAISVFYGGYLLTHIHNTIQNSTNNTDNTLYIGYKKLPTPVAYLKNYIDNIKIYDYVKFRAEYPATTASIAPTLTATPTRTVTPTPSFSSTMSATPTPTPDGGIVTVRPPLISLDFENGLIDQGSLGLSWVHTGWSRIHTESPLVGDASLFTGTTFGNIQTAERIPPIFGNKYVEFTVECVIRINEDVAGGAIMSYDTGAPTSGTILYITLPDMSSLFVNIGTGGGAIKFDKVRFIKNTHHHIAVTRNQTTTSVYIDGVFIQSIVSTGYTAIPVIDARFCLGGTENNSVPVRSFKNSIDMFKFYDYVKYVGDFTKPETNPPPTDNILVGNRSNVDMDFENGYENKGYRNLIMTERGTGTIVTEGALVGSSSFRTGLSGSVTSQPTTEMFSISTGFTIEFFLNIVNELTDTTIRYIVSQNIGSASDDVWDVHMSGMSIIRFRGSAIMSTFNLPEPLIAGNVYHIAITLGVNSNLATLYLDGIAITTANVPNILTRASTQLTIGQKTTIVPNAYWDFIIDELKIFNYNRYLGNFTPKLPNRFAPQ